MGPSGKQIAYFFTKYLGILRTVTRVAFCPLLYVSFHERLTQSLYAAVLAPVACCVGAHKSTRSVVLLGGPKLLFKGLSGSVQFGGYVSAFGLLAFWGKC